MPVTNRFSPLLGVTMEKEATAEESGAEQFTVASPATSKQRQSKIKSSSVSEAVTFDQHPEPELTAESKQVEKMAVACDSSLHTEPVQMHGRDATACAPQPRTEGAQTTQVEPALPASFIPGKLVCLVNDRQNLIRMNFSVNGVTSLATIDSGASRSIINQTVAEKFQLTINSDISNLNVLGDDNVSVLGTCSALISVGGVELGSIDFAVIKNTPFCQNLFIVGVEFLTDKMEICPKDRKLIKYYSNQSSVEFYFDDSGAVNTKL